MPQAKIRNLSFEVNHESNEKVQCQNSYGIQQRLTYFDLEV